jgi:hypothetical protein
MIFSIGGGAWLLTEGFFGVALAVILIVRVLIANMGPTVLLASVVGRLAGVLAVLRPLALQEVFHWDGCRREGGHENCEEGCWLHFGGLELCKTKKV